MQLLRLYGISVQILVNGLFFFGTLFWQYYHFPKGVSRCLTKKAVI